MIRKVDLRKNLDLVTVLHLNQAHIIIYRNNIPDISAVTYLQKL